MLLDAIVQTLSRSRSGTPKPDHRATILKWTLRVVEGCLWCALSILLTPDLPTGHWPYGSESVSGPRGGKLTGSAGRRGVSPEVLIRDAIERAGDYDDWFIAKSRRDSPKSRPGRC